MEYKLNLDILKSFLNRLYPGYSILVEFIGSLFFKHNEEIYYSTYNDGKFIVYSISGATALIRVL